MAKFTPIDLNQMEEFLGSLGFSQFVPASNFQIRESVFGKRIANDLTLRVYTGIERGNSRGNGKDAIRCTVFRRFTDGRIVMVHGAKRVHRVEHWKKNLKNRIGELEKKFNHQNSNK